MYPSAGKLDISTEPLSWPSQFSRAGYSLDEVPLHAHGNQGELDIDSGFRGLPRFFIVKYIKSVVQIKLFSFLDRAGDWRGMDTCSYPSRCSICIETDSSFLTKPKVGLLYIVALWFKNLTSYEWISVTRSYHKIIAGEARSASAVTVVLELNEVGISFGRYPGLNVCSGLHYLCYRN